MPESFLVFCGWIMVSITFLTYKEYIMGFNDYDDDFYDNTQHDPDFYDTIDNVVDEDEDDYDDSMDGDHDSAMRDAGWGTDEDYGYFGGEDY